MIAVWVSSHYKAPHDPSCMFLHLGLAGGPRPILRVLVPPEWRTRKLSSHQGNGVHRTGTPRADLGKCRLETMLNRSLATTALPTTNGQTVQAAIWEVRGRPP